MRHFRPGTTTTPGETETAKENGPATTHAYRFFIQRP